MMKHFLFRLVQVSITQVLSQLQCQFQNASYVYIRQMCTTPKIVIFIFLKNKNLFHYLSGEAVFYFIDFCSFLDFYIVSFSCGQTQICPSVVNHVSLIFCLDRLILLFRPLLWHIQTNVQQLNCEIIKILNKICFLCCDKYCGNRFSVIDSPIIECSRLF